MAAQRLEDLSSRALEDELATLAGHLAAGMCRWLELVAEVDRRGSFGPSGCDSCSVWLAWRCSLTPRSAREHVRVARALGDLPLTREKFARGELSYAKVRAITRVADADTEALLVEYAGVMTAAQLERTVACYRRVTSKEARDLDEYARIHVWWDDDGCLMVHGRLAPDDGALLLRALDAAKDRLGENADGGSAEPRRRATNAHALAAVAEASLAAAQPRSGGDRYQVVVHVDADTLTGEGEAGCTLEHGPAIAPETARRLACDASILQISERNGRPLRAGRKTRSIPPALRRALDARDRRCRFPGCEHRLYLHGHHIRHWAHGGETNLDNLVLLCTRHHKLVHEGGYTVDERKRFHDPWGLPIPPSPAPARGDPEQLLTGNSDRQIGPRTSRPGNYDRLDLDLAVDGLLRVGSSLS